MSSSASVGTQEPAQAPVADPLISAARDPTLLSGVAWMAGKESADRLKPLGSESGGRRPVRGPVAAGGG
jgi:hypothetical protein